jgi:hypothetical protein
MHVEKLDILNKFLGDYVKDGHEFLFYCPVCSHHKPKLSVNIEKNKFKCWVCEYAGNLNFLVQKRASIENIREWQSLNSSINISSFGLLFEDEVVKEVTNLSLPKEYVPLCGSNLNEYSIDAIKYLLNRGISIEDIYKWKIGFCYSGIYMNRIIIPSFDIHGKLNYYIGRDYTGKAYRAYKASDVPKNIIFNEINIDWSRPVTLTEGVFDAIKCGDNSIPLLGKTLTKSSILMQKIIINKCDVYLGLDIDADKNSKKIIEQLNDFGINVYKINCYPYKDIGEMTKEIFLQKKNSAEYIFDKMSQLKSLFINL